MPPTGVRRSASLPRHGPSGRRVLRRHRDLTRRAPGCQSHL